MHIYAPAYCLTGVCLSFCLSAGNLTCELNIFLKLPYYSSYNTHIWYADQVTIPVFGMQVAFDNTHRVRVISLRSRSNMKVTFLKNGRFGGISVSQTHLVCILNILFNPLPDDKISDWSYLKQIADDILKCIKNEKKKKKYQIGLKTL